MLPFTDMSPAKDQECFCDGMTEELINALTQIPGLRVAARTSAFQFKGQARDVRQIGDALNVATVLDGSVRKDGNRLRITVELIGSADGYHLWSERFDRNLDDVFAVQDEIAASVVSTLKGKLAAGKSAVVVAPRSQDLEAYEFYLEGRYHWNKRTEDELKKSVACFERAIERDPELRARPMPAWPTPTSRSAPTAPCRPRTSCPVRSARLERALEIDAGLAEAYTCRGCVRSVYDWSWSDAEHDFRRAIDLQTLVSNGAPLVRHQPPRAAGTLRRSDRGAAPRVGSRSARARDQDQRGNEMLFCRAVRRRRARAVEGPSSSTKASAWLGSFSGQPIPSCPDILKPLESLRPRSASPDAVPKSWRRSAIFTAVSGRHRQRRGASWTSSSGSQASGTSRRHRLAQVHVGLGERAEALDRLEEAHAERAADLAWLNVRPVFASLRAEPRFTALVTEMCLAVRQGPNSQ